MRLVLNRQDRERMDELEETKQSVEPLEVPEFKPTIPKEIAELWHTLTPVEKFLIEKNSISEQQNKWIIDRLCAGHVEIRTLRNDVAGFKRLRLILNAKWSVVFVVLSGLALPVFVALLIHYFTRK